MSGKVITDTNLVSVKPIFLVVKHERKHEMGAKNKNFRVFEKYLHEILNNKHETDCLKYAVMNIKYEYLYNSEHKISNMKLRTCNMKHEHKHETWAKVKNFGVFRK